MKVFSFRPAVRIVLGLCVVWAGASLAFGQQGNRGGRSKRSGFIATKPPRQVDTASNVSE